MTFPDSSPTAGVLRRIVIVMALALAVALLAPLLLKEDAVQSTQTTDAPEIDSLTTAGAAPSRSAVDAAAGADAGNAGDAATEAHQADGVVDVYDGVLPKGTSVFDSDYPGVNRLDPELLAALRSAAMDASAAGVSFELTSGWRSVEFQAQLLAEGVATYGSVAAAAQWVATPETSAHVSGDAVDIGGAAARDWLSRYGDAYGLCQVYANESWHFELFADAASRGCPEMYADPSQDPRLAGAGAGVGGQSGASGMNDAAPKPRGGQR